MAPSVSLKPIETVIKKTQRKLRELSRKAPPKQKKKIDSTIKELNLCIRHIIHVCAKGYTIGVKPPGK